MKKNLFILAAAALAFTACSSDETIAVNEGLADANTISFRALNDGMTRATPKTSFATNDEIDVFAEYKIGEAAAKKYFQDSYKKADGSTFAPSTAGRNYYWPAMASNKMIFTAFSGVTQSASTAGSLDAAFSPEADAANQVDILFSRHEVSGAAEQPVLLNFRHMLSQIDVKVKNSNAGLEFDITGVRIGYTATEGTFACTATTDTKNSGKLAQNTWTPTALTGNAEAKANTYKYDVTGLTKNISGKVDDATAITGFSTWMLIPQNITGATAYARQTSGSASSAPELNGGYVAIKMNIKNTLTDDVIVAEQWCYWPIPNATWNPGYKYTYVVDLAGGGYQPADQENNNTNLDPVLGTPILMSASCTIDDWDTDLNDNDTDDDDIDANMIP